MANLLHSLTRKYIYSLFGLMVTPIFLSSTERFPWTPTTPTAHSTFLLRYQCDISNLNVQDKLNSPHHTPSPTPVLLTSLYTLVTRNAIKPVTPIKTLQSTLTCLLKIQIQPVTKFHWFYLKIYANANHCYFF